ncbi:ParB/RepB/Spo0J family partition protein [Cellulomonas sp. S1-8]|uniref:ParB/RepB/Spo0J family partition protein n=1 Tax=Cellulomonas sp. S1-8 TaxID=2904790 RepID=UPI002243E58A|nr:ParB/RepB/Spo0J family partition protein [Cellulomonas sp. S1-8]UZN03363.1 ParB/RepB/Spo0J family partition protein [Cellulomonas sp. S1-8]
MSEKRRGLGRGLGALIPTGLDTPRSTGDRPVDVFFPDTVKAEADAEAAAVAAAEAALAGGPAAAPPADGQDSTPSTDAPPESTDTPTGVAAATAVPDTADDTGLLPVPGARFAELPVGSIRPNPRQPRHVFDEDALAELVGSIREIGVLQPVVVRAAEDGYELIMGERRWRATQEAGLATIPAIVRETDDADLLRDALLENLHRAELNPLEEAAAYQQLLDDFGCTHEQLAARIHRSRPQISNTLRLLRLPPLVQRRLAAGVLSAGHARALLGLSDGAAIERLAQRVVSEGLSVRAVEEIVSLGGDESAPTRRQRPRAGVRNEALDELASRLSDRFETRVKVDLGKTRGKLTVEFASVQDLNRILGALAPEDPGVLKN